MANPNGTDIQVATDSGFSDLVVDDSGAYRTSRNFVPDELPYGVNLYMRARHRHPETGTSAWSSTVRFQVISPANIIGVCLDNTPTKGVFYWIDAEGNKVSSFDFHDHPTYAGISMATTDASRSPVTLTKFPKFYVKTAASGPTNTFASGKKCWWISDIEATGFRPAACFKRSKSQSGGKYVISDYCYMGTYLGHTETVGGKTCIGSKIGQTVRASTTKANFKTYITNRNNTSAGETGYRMFDIWDLGALRMLLLIAKADSDTQTVWGDNTAGTSYPKTGSTGARVAFKGTQSKPEVRMDDLWRCYWYHADLISVSSGKVSLVSPMDLTSSLSFGSAATSRYTQPTKSGWIRDVLDCPFVIGDDTHDLMELFLPKTVVSAENQATFSDYHPLQGSTTSDVLAIGYGIQKDLSFTKRDHGIFAQEMDCYSSANNAGEFLSSFVMTHYHLLIFDYGHGWGSYFGIGGTFDPNYLSSYSTLGMFLSHPTFAPAPYDAAGSSTEQISSYCFR